MAKPERHNSEALILELWDGSIIRIEAVPNIRQLIDEGGPVTPEALQVAFDVTYVLPDLFYRPELSAPDLVWTEVALVTKRIALLSRHVQY